MICLFLIIILKLILIICELPINNLDNYEIYNTNISSDYILTINNINKTYFYANNSQYLLTGDGTISYITNFSKLGDYSSLSFDSHNNISYISCIEKYLLLGSNKMNYSSPSITKMLSYKCSNLFYTDSNGKTYHIITFFVYQTIIFLQDFKIYFYKFDSNLNKVNSFSENIEKYFNNSEAESSSCIYLKVIDKILCLYKYPELIGSFINENFSGLYTKYYIHGKKNDIKEFILFTYKDEFGLVISRNSNNNIFYLTILEYSKGYVLKKTNITNFESELDLNNIGVSIYDEGVFIGTKLNDYIYIYNIIIDNYTKYIIKIENKDNIKQISLFYFDGNYLGILFRTLDSNKNIYNISYTIFSNPKSLNCQPKNLTCYSRELLNINITDIFPFYSNAYLKQNPFNFEISDTNITGISLEHGLYNTIIYYLYNNLNQKIYYIDDLCYFTYQICNEACNSCNVFSNNSNDTQCIDCLESYAPLVNYTSQCEKKTNNISFYYYNSTDNIFNKCYETCLYCSQEGNITDNNCDVCLNDNYRISYIKSKQCTICKNEKILYYYSSDEGSICLDESITKCPDDYPYLISVNNECVQTCPTSYPINFNNTCLKECQTELGYKQNYNTCICNEEYLYYYDIEDNNNLICIIDSNNCPIKYPILNQNTNECEKKEDTEEIINNEETKEENEEVINNEETKEENEEVINNEETKEENEEVINNEETSEENEEVINNEEPKEENEEVINNEETSEENEEVINNEETKEENEEKINSEETSEENEETKEDNKKIIYNGETIEECPKFTSKVDKGDYYSCLCINPYYIINNKIYCNSNSSCNDKEYKLLIKEENLCVKECNNNYPIEFKNYCLKKCPNGYTYYKNNCLIISGFETDEEVTIEIYDSFTIMKGLKFIALTYESDEKSIESANSYGNLSSIDFDECIEILKEKYNIPESENLIIIKLDILRNDSVTNQVEYTILNHDGTTLDLNYCSDVDIKIENTVKISNEELNLDKALEVFEYGYDIYNSNDSFYTSICTIFTNGNGTDVPLENRKSDYYTNISFCEDGCYYDGINLTSLRVSCSCKIKTSVSNEEKGFSVQSLGKEFTSVISNSNIRVFICYKQIFNKNIVKNYAFWFLLLCFSGEITFMILYFFTGFQPIYDKIKKAKKVYSLEIEGKNKEKNQNKNEFPKIIFNLKPIDNYKIDNSTNNNILYHNSTARIIIPPKNPPKSKNNHLKLSVSGMVFDSNCSDRNIDTHSIEIKVNTNREKSIHINDFSKYIDEKKSNCTSNKERKINNNELYFINDFHKKKKKKKLKFITPYEKYNPDNMVNGNEIKIYSNRLKIMRTINNDISNNSTEKDNTNDELINVFYNTDEYLNHLKYNEALKEDKRTFLKIYYGFLKYSQLIIFSFITNSDYNLKYIKIILCIFSFIGYFFFNTLFFNDKSMANIYKNRGKYEVLYSIPKTLFSSLCCILINMSLKFISLSNKHIIKLSNEKDPKKEKIELKKLVRCLKIKLIIFFILVILFSSVCWYYVTAFCSVYINTKLHLIKNTVLSFTESMLYPFGICLITTSLRKISLRFKIKIIFYISKIMQKI